MDLNRSLNEALVAFREGNLTLARDITGAIQRKHPGEPGSLRLMGQIEYLEGQIEEAVKAMEKSLKAKPDQYSLWVKLGNAYSELGKWGKAEDAFSTAIPYSNDPHLAYLSRAQVRAQKGAFEDAFKDLDFVRKKIPSLGQTYRLMLKLGHPMVKTNEFAETLSPKLASRVMQGEDAVQGHYALTGYYEKFEPERMWFHLHQANGLQKNRAREWEPTYRQIIERSKELFTEGFLQGTAKPKSSLTPVFIVGVPRSGSTLLEHMLAGHPKITGAGETNLVTRIIGQIQSETLLSYPNGVETLEAEQWGRFASIYYEGIKTRSENSPVTVDKLLSNAFFVGLILKLMPGAKIIHLRRDPLDTAFSIYKNHFWEGQSPEFCSLKGIGTYFGLVDEIMAHWKKVCPGKILEINYEILVENPERTLKKTLEFIGVTWDENCLDFQNAKTLSNTLSTAQVTRPLNKDSIGTGAQYREQLAPFLAAYKKESA